MRLYRLGKLVWPDEPQGGSCRSAGEADAGVLTAWFRSFAREANDGEVADAFATVREQLGYGGITVCEAGGELVSFASITRPADGMVRVGPVYTPPERRGRGYGSLVTAAASWRALRAGAEEVLLYTDPANPVPNSIYQRIGYRPVEDRVVLAFSGG
jgi:predicted GNAT family acetyltransferase